MASATPAHAGSVITVNTLTDNNGHGDGLCTLREAIDGGSACPSTDQRGEGRVGLACDIGAMEYHPGEATPFLWLPLILR